MITLKKIKSFHFELYHVIILLVIVILSQIMLSYISVKSIDNVLNKSMDLYRWDTAERLADLTTTSLELLMQPSFNSPKGDTQFLSSTVEALDFTITQQSLQKNVEDICLLFYAPDNKIIDVDQGADLYNYLINNIPPPQHIEKREVAKKWFREASYNLFNKESISTFKEGSHTFHILVPFSKHGEVLGAVYMKITPNFNNIIQAVSSSYDQSGALISAVILLSLLAMFSITTFLAKDRDIAQYELYKHKEIELKQRIEMQKESYFTKRIYHAHHKAEKIVGFIKEDLRNLAGSNLELIKIRLFKYSSFIGRVIYDMKTHTPPVNVIRNAGFKTDLNSVINFIIDNIFRRVYKEGDQYKFDIRLDERVPFLQINEYVIWQIIEPIIQNSIDHNQRSDITIGIRTIFYPVENKTIIILEDNGRGINPDLLRKNENGVKQIFLENFTTKDQPGNSGYGCYLAYESCRLCGWILDADNKPSGGAIMTITITHPVGKS